MERAEKARKAFFRYRDKSYSFTDCTSLMVMQELRIKQALTTDRHFRQMGLQVLPR
jgi:predicted nucleic acid-binding protein